MRIFDHTRENLMKAARYDDPGYRELEKSAKLFLALNFNRINPELIQRATDGFHVIQPSLAALAGNFVTEFSDQFPEYEKEYTKALKEGSYTASFAEYLQEYHNNDRTAAFVDEINAFDEWARYPKGGVFYEAGGRIVAEWLEQNVDDLHKIGISVVCGNELHNVGFFPREGGDNAYSKSFIPLYRIITADIETGNI